MSGGGRHARVRRAVLLSLALMTGSAPAFSENPDRVGGAALAGTGFEALAGWTGDDHAAAFSVFRRSCAALADGRTVARPGLPASAALLAVCRDALTVADPDRDTARRFFEQRFTPRIVESGGFLTGYFEPEIVGSRMPGARFSAPLLARPADLVTVRAGEPAPELPPGVTSARRSGDRLVPYPDRAAIEDGGLGELAVPIVHVDPVDAFVVHVQGSARVRLVEGGALRLAYAARNGRPYTSIGRVLTGERGVEPGAMTMDKVVVILREDPADARRIMRLNESYIFFRLADELDPAEGPLGAASVQLTAGRSIAVDRDLWPYGLPFWIETSLPEPAGGTVPHARLFVAQDTGSAIVGAARADLFMGTGGEAGLRAGLVRQPARFVVLLPKAAGSGQ